MCGRAGQSRVEFIGLYTAYREWLEKRPALPFIVQRNLTLIIAGLKLGNVSPGVFRSLGCLVVADTDNA